MTTRTMCRREVMAGACRGACVPEDLQLYYQVGLLGRRDLPLITDQRSGFAMTLVRMLAFRPGWQQWRDCCGRRPVPAALRGRMQCARGCGLNCSRRLRLQHLQRRVRRAPAAAAHRNNWTAIVEQLGLCGLARQLAANCALLAAQGGQIRLLLDARSQSIRTAGNRGEAQLQRWSRYCGEPVRLCRSNWPMPRRPPPRRHASAIGRPMNGWPAPARARDPIPNIQALRSADGRDDIPRFRAAQFSPRRTEHMRGNIGNLLKQAQAVQENLQKAQDAGGADHRHRRIRRRHGEGHHERQA